LIPRSGPPAATLSGGLRSGSLRVHAPCREIGHGARLGFPGRRSPRGPAAPGMSLGACTCGQASKIPDEGRCLREGEGEWAWTRRNLVCPRSRDGLRTGTAGQGAPPTGTQCRWGMAVLVHDRTARRGSTMVRQTDPWNCSAGEAPVPEPCRAGPGARGRLVLPPIPPSPFRPDSNGGVERALSFPAPLVERSGRGVSGGGYDVGERSRPVQRFWTFASASKVRQRSMSRVRDASGRMRPVSMWNFSMSPSLMMGFLGSPLG